MKLLAAAGPAPLAGPPVGQRHQQSASVPFATPITSRQQTLGLVPPPPFLSLCLSLLKSSTIFLSQVFAHNSHVLLWCCVKMCGSCVARIWPRKTPAVLFYFCFISPSQVDQIGLQFILANDGTWAKCCWHCWFPFCSNGTFNACLYASTMWHVVIGAGAFLRHLVCVNLRTKDGTKIKICFWSSSQKSWWVSF